MPVKLKLRFSFCFVFIYLDFSRTGHQIMDWHVSELQRGMILHVSGAMENAWTWIKLCKNLLLSGKNNCSMNQPASKKKKSRTLESPALKYKEKVAVVLAKGTLCEQKRPKSNVSSSALLCPAGFNREASELDIIVLKREEEVIERRKNRMWQRDEEKTKRSHKKTRTRKKVESDETGMR